MLTSKRAFVLVVVVVLALFSGQWSGPAWGQGGELCVVFSGGRGDLSFNDMAAIGANRASSELGLSVNFVETASEADVLPSLRSLSRSGNCALVVSVGETQTEDVSTAALEFPNQKYLSIGNPIPERANLQSVQFSEHVGSALVGALAALINNNVGGGGAGIVIGAEFPTLWRFECGFKWGVRWVDNGMKADFFDQATINKDTLLPSVYVGSFEDPAKGRSATEAQLAQGVSVVYQVAGQTGLGIIAAVADAARADGDEVGPPFAIGVDADQDWQSGGGIVVASMMKRVDLAVFDGAKAVVGGTFQTGIVNPPGGGVSVSNLSTLGDFLQLAVDAGQIKAGDKDAIAAQVKALRERFAAEFAAVESLSEQISSGQVSIPFPETQDDINACRAKLDS